VFARLFKTGKVRELGRRLAVEKSDHRQRWLLRTQGERPSRRRAAKQRDELAPFQLIELHPVPPALGTTVS
jgi:hypothetical protein